MPVLAPSILPMKLSSILTPVTKGPWVNCACSYKVFINVYTHLYLISFAQHFSNEIHSLNCGDRSYFSFLNSISLNEYIIIYLSIQLLIGIWIVSRF